MKLKNEITSVYSISLHTALLRLLYKLTIDKQQEHAPGLMMERL
ncbi:hypothetical protein [Bathymodiolus platifrons methanotrophic gill symbiont]|nr:hypothetical protein [Bathymodiolus platifrons methanotrophic gill symbiont]